jgi:hypothetical protein
MRSALAARRFRCFTLTRPLYPPIVPTNLVERGWATRGHKHRPRAPDFAVDRAAGRKSKSYVGQAVLVLLLENLYG